MPNQYTDNTPQHMRSITYTRLEPVWAELTELGDVLQRLRTCTELLDGFIASERPSETMRRCALQAYEQLPELAMALEEAVEPQQINKLMRRIARLRGVKADRFALHTGARRFEP